MRIRQVASLPVEQAARVVARLRLPPRAVAPPICPHPESEHVIEADGTEWCRTCTAAR